MLGTHLINRETAGKLKLAQSAPKNVERSTHAYNVSEITTATTATPATTATTAATATKAASTTATTTTLANNSKYY